MANLNGPIASIDRVDFPGGVISVTAVAGQACTLDSIANMLATGDYGGGPYAVTILGSTVYMEVTDELEFTAAAVQSDLNALCTP